MTRDELDALGVTCDLQTAARALGLSKSAAYALAEKGKFPVPVIRWGSRYSVPTAGLRQLLLGETPPPADQVLDRLDRICNSLDLLVDLLKAQAISSIQVA